MRVSNISRWMLCEGYALADPQKEPSRQSVATVVGSMAHHQLTGQPFDRPARVTYDRVTASWHQAEQQATQIARTAKVALEAGGWQIVATETEVAADGDTGHVDLECDHPDHGAALIDLKTGQHLMGAWLQVGGYLAIHPDQTIRWGGVLTVPRRSLCRETQAQVEFRNAALLKKAWGRWSQRLDAILEGAPALLSPGRHCGNCPLKHCPVRAV